LPGDIASLIGGTDATPEQIAKIRLDLGLNDNLVQQYINWLLSFITLNFGMSPLTGIDIATDIVTKFSFTLTITLSSLLFGLLIAIGLTILRTSDPKSKLVKAIDSFLQFSAYMPSVVLSMIFILLFSKLGLFPVFPTSSLSDWDNPGLTIFSLILPSLIVGLVIAIPIYRISITSIEQALESEYYRFSLSKGLSPVPAFIRHCLKNSSSAVLSITLLQLVSMLTGVVVVEKLFNIQGFGNMIIHDIMARDLPKVETEIMLLALFTLIVGFAIDILSRMLNPKLLIGVTNE
jgi:peptide/nickel transport system permease protein